MKIMGANVSSRHKSAATLSSIYNPCWFPFFATKKNGDDAPERRSYSIPSRFMGALPVSTLFVKPKTNLQKMLHENGKNTFW